MYPFFSRNLEIENLQYLDIDQALEDLAHFIRYQKTALPGSSDSGMILVGGHYAGSLAAWFLQRYPNLANGAWSFSAPLKTQVDFLEYKEVVGMVIRAVAGQPCYNRIQRVFKNVLSTHGSLDPWSALGLPTTTVMGAPVVIIPCKNRYSLGLCNSLTSFSYMSSSCIPLQ
jgi:Serine carboxypeptidase S28